MFGKGSLITVFGFIAAFSVYQLNISKTLLDTQENFTRQYIASSVHHSAVSAMNYSINWLWTNDTTSGSLQINNDLCSTLVTITTVGFDSILVRVNSHAFYFEDGEFSESGNQTMIADSLIAFFTYRKPLSEFFWFTDTEGIIYWITGDTVTGPIHTNDLIRTHGAPVFEGKVTSLMGITPDPATSSAVFNGGYEIGVSHTIPTDMSQLTDAAILGNGGAAMNTKSLYDQPTLLEFLADGQIIRTVNGGTPDTTSVAAIAPNGVISSTADFSLKGTFTGELTIYSTGDIWIEDDLVYADDPLSNPASTDLLGLVAQNDIIISDNAANNSDCHIQSSMIALTGSLRAENYDTRPTSGTLNITGSIVQNARGAVSTFNWGGSLRSGFYKKYQFDDRLSSTSPPHYPFLRTLSLAGWWE